MKLDEEVAAAVRAQLIAEGLRSARFPGIEFRNTTLGRMA